MAVAGALIGGALGAFGKKPVIPDLPQIDPGQVQGQAIQGNLTNLPKAQQLGADVNAFNASQAQSLFKQALDFLSPGGFNKVSGIIGNQLNGEVPQDVQRQLLQSGAARALSSGTSGSGFARNATLRDLGLTSLNLQQQGLSNITSLTSQFKAPQFDLTSMFFSPQQRLEFAFQDRGAHFQRNLLANQVAAAPDPYKAALGRELDRFFNTVASASMSYAGAMSGGGMGGGMGGG